MPAAVWYSDKEKITENIKYKYDSCGNICQITQNGHVTTKYTYDNLNRLIREDNKPLNKTVLFTYDQNGNITERCLYAYTLKGKEELAGWACEHHSYDYEGDKLISYNGEACAYNSLGNPTTYRGKSVTWQYGTRMIGLGSTTFAYDGLGKRTRTGSISLSSTLDGKIVKQSNDLEFIYDNAGIIGVKYSSTQYFYRKDAQGYIIAILDSSGSVLVNYIYDAWGNHAIVDNNGNDVTSGIGVLNPFRYRGYYYDTETGLYFLQTRYYDPEVGRFISQDSVDYADPETVNGLNLYAYCGNNPVNMVDPDGTLPKWLKWLIAGVTTVILIAGAVVLTVASGGIASPSLAFAAQFGGSILTGAAVSATFSLASQLSTGNIDLRTYFIDVGVGALSGAASFGVGQIFSAAGGSIGTYLNQITIKGLKVGQVFGNSLQKIIGKVAEFSGGIIFGTFIDKSINELLGKNGSLQERLNNNLYGGIFSNILEFLKNIW